MKWMLKAPRRMDMFQALNLAKDAGFDGIEIQLYSAPEEVDWAEELKALAVSKDMLLSIHCPSGDLNLTSSNGGIRRESLRQMKETIVLAKELGALHVTFHPGRLSSLREDKRVPYELMCNIVQELSCFAKEQGVRLGMENMENRAKETFISLESVLELLKNAEDGTMGVTLDFAHLYGWDPAMDISSLKDRVVNVHISQCVDDKPHFGLYVENGQYEICDCIQKLKNIGYDGTVVVEAKDTSELEKMKANLQVLCESDLNVK